MLEIGFSLQVQYSRPQGWLCIQSVSLRLHSVFLREVYYEGSSLADKSAVAEALLKFCFIALRTFTLNSCQY